MLLIQHDKRFICGCPLRKCGCESCSQDMRLTAMQPRYAVDSLRIVRYANENPNMRLTANDVVMDLRPTAMHEGTACGMYILSRRLAATIILAVDRYMETRGGNQFTDSCRGGNQFTDLWSRRLVEPNSRGFLREHYGILCRIPQLPLVVPAVMSTSCQMVQQHRPCLMLAFVRLAVPAFLPHCSRALPLAWAIFDVVPQVHLVCKWMRCRGVHLSGCTRTLLVRVRAGIMLQ